MKQLIEISLRVVFFCFAVMMLQTALVEDIVINNYGIFSINLIFVSIIAFASTTTIFEACLAAIAFTALSTMFSYNGQIEWFYIVFAILASKLNPSNIADKFLVAIIMTLLFTPVLELFNPLSVAYLNKVLNASIVNTLAIIPIYFIIRIIFYRKRFNSVISLSS